MSITNELRESVKQTNWAMTSKAKWFAIADRIDIEHKKAVDIAFTNGRTEGIADGCAYYDTEHTECMLSEEHGWIRLPKDADGEVIHIGDMMECEKLPNGNRVCGEVKAISNDCVWLTNVQYKIHAKYLRHHHEPTVEDVLREFGDKYCDMVAGSDKERELFAEYASKLQLRGDGE